MQFLLLPPALTACLFSPAPHRAVRYLPFAAHWARPPYALPFGMPCSTYSGCGMPMRPHLYHPYARSFFWWLPRRRSWCDSPIRYTTARATHLALGRQTRACFSVAWAAPSGARKGSFSCIAGRRAVGRDGGTQASTPSPPTSHPLTYHTTPSHTATCMPSLTHCPPCTLPPHHLPLPFHHTPTCHLPLHTSHAPTHTCHHTCKRNSIPSECSLLPLLDLFIIYKQVFHAIHSVPQPPTCRLPPSFGT